MRLIKFQNLELNGHQPDITQNDGCSIMQNPMLGGHICWNWLAKKQHTNTAVIRQLVQSYKIIQTYTVQQSVLASQSFKSWYKATKLRCFHYSPWTTCLQWKMAGPFSTSQFECRQVCFFKAAKHFVHFTAGSEALPEADLDLCDGAGFPSSRNLCSRCFPYITNKLYIYKHINQISIAGIAPPLLSELVGPCLSQIAMASVALSG